MLKSVKLLFLILLSTSLVIFHGAFQIKLNRLTENISCSLSQITPDELIINWQANLKLKREDFKAITKNNSRSSVATTSSGFGYNITDNGGKISGSIFVRFYCSRSWWNPDLIDKEKVMYVLNHEQIHFDICELFGRKLYKGVIELRNSEKINSKTIDKLQSKLEKQYFNYQDKYDKETNHSINRVEQHYWNMNIAKELASMAEYSDYSSF